MGQRTLVFDVETTGLASYDRVVSIAGVWCDGLEPTPEHFYLVFNPKKRCHPKAAEAHGLKDWWLRYQPPFEDFASDLRLMFDRADLVVGHNVAFDVRMINHEFEKADEPPLNVPTFCTMEAFRARFPGQSANLDACLAEIGMSRSTNTHSALEDSILTMNLYRWLHGKTESCAPSSPLLQATNAVAIPKDVLWANQVDSTPAWIPCPNPPESVKARLAEIGIDVQGFPPRAVRLLLAARKYALALDGRTAAAESPDQIRGLVCALADSPEFAEPLREWARWAWGRPNPQVPHDELRTFAEELLHGLV
jgi:DNA polymerase-3 subunit epsilon